MQEVNREGSHPPRHRAIFRHAIQDTDLYGLGEQLGGLRRNDSLTPIFNRDNFAYGQGENLYQAHPWVLGVRPDGSSFGLLADTPSRGEVDLRNGHISFEFESPFRVIAIEGGSPEHVLKSLAQLTGTITLPPLWALGYQQCRFSYLNEKEGKDIMKNFRERKLPCDVIWFDIDYMDGYRVFTFDPQNFPHPKKLNRYAHKHNFKTVWMIDPGVKAEDGYSVYDKLKQKGLYVKKPALEQGHQNADINIRSSSSTDTMAFLCDGQLETSWIPEDEDDKPWIEIDMGSLNEILDIDIYWKASFPEYRVMSSQDGQNWTFFADHKGKNYGGQHHLKGKRQIQGRYLKLEFLTPNLPQQYAIEQIALNGEFFAEAKQNFPDDMCIGKVWPGRCAFPDFTNPKTAKWWAKLYRDFMATGIDGVWNDMNEPAVFGGGPQMTLPDNAQHEGGVKVGNTAIPSHHHAHYHNAYGMLMVKATREGILKANPNKRPFVLSRANLIGGHRYGATWTGDNLSTDEHMHIATAMCVNLGLSGQPFSGPDLGGFAGPSPSPELFCQWMAVGVFYPFMRGHATKSDIRKEPWVFGKRAETSVRRSLHRRYRLLDYIYTCFQQASTTGVPLMRPAFWADLRLKRLRNEQDKFMFGPDLFIVPPWAKTKTMPRGNWQQISLVSGDLKDPHQPQVWLRPGAILALSEPRESTSHEYTGPITYLVNPDKNGQAEGSHYEDKGDGWGFQKGKYRLAHLKLQMENSDTSPRSKIKASLETSIEGSFKGSQRKSEWKLCLGEGRLKTISIV